MNAIELLIDHPSLTAEMILSATDDPREIAAAAEKALAGFAQLEAAAVGAQRANNHAVEQARLYLGMPGALERIDEMLRTHAAAEQALAAFQAAMERYRPWQEAIDCVRQARLILQQIESN